VPQLLQLLQLLHPLLCLSSRCRLSATDIMNASGFNTHVTDDAEVPARSLRRHPPLTPPLAHRCLTSQYRALQRRPSSSLARLES